MLARAASDRAKPSIGAVTAPQLLPEAPAVALRRPGFRRLIICGGELHPLTQHPTDTPTVGGEPALQRVLIAGRRVYERGEGVDALREPP